MSKRVGVLLIVLLSLFSCNRKITNTFEKDLVIDSFDFHYLTAKAKIKYQSDGNSLSATANIRISKDSLIWMSVSPGLGVEAARVLIQKDSIFFIDRINKKFFTGNIPALSEKYKFDFSYEILESVIIGNLIYPYSKEDLVNLPGGVSYIQRKENVVFNNFIGSKSRKLERLLVTDLNTNSSISVNYGNFQMVGEEIFPYDIEAKLEYEKSEKSKTDISIGFSKAQIEDKPLKFPFSIPSKYSSM
jgi:hypothetical protein